MNEPWSWKLGRQLLAIAATLLLGGFLAAMLVRAAPGFDVDEHQLDSRLSPATIASMRAEKVAQRNVFRFYADYLGHAIHGDLGRSQTLDRPVSELIRERLPVTMKIFGMGLLLAWVLAFLLATTTAMSRSGSYEMAATGFSAALLCIPSAVVALFFVYANAPASIAITLIVFPRVYRYARNLLARCYDMPHIITARAKGLGPVRVLVWHVLPVAGPQLFAVVGVSISIALGAAIPVEALCGIPGIGQLAWQAALGRDLVLLVTLTLLVTVITLTANSACELAGDAFRTVRA
jgi:peptide/nickel transport system permease protein